MPPRPRRNINEEAHQRNVVALRSWATEAKLMDGVRDVDPLISIRFLEAILRK